jgi:hypothetical protein
MNQTAEHTTTTDDGRKSATWRLTGRRPWILRVQVRDDASPAVEWPDTPLPAVQPGTLVFKGAMELVDARERLGRHQDLWDAVQRAFWAAVLDTGEIPVCHGGAR